MNEYMKDRVNEPTSKRMNKTTTQLMKGKNERTRENTIGQTKEKLRNKQRKISEQTSK